MARIQEEPEREIAGEREALAKRPRAASREKPMSARGA